MKVPTGKPKICRKLFFFYIISGLVIVLLSFSCARFSIREINFYDEKTALENQILGTYKEIEADPWLTTSVRISSPDALGLTRGDEAIDSAVFDAFRTRFLIEDSIDDFRQRGILGEGLDGMLRIVQSPDLSDAELRELDDLLQIENNARITISTFIARINREISPMTEQDIGRVLHSVFCQEAPLGTQIETEPDHWQKKNNDVTTSENY